METLTTTNRAGTKGMSAALKLVDHSSIVEGLFALHLDLPNEKVNKFSTSFTAEMRDQIEALKKRKDIKALVVLSDKEGIFIAGADIELIRTVKTPDDGYTLAKQAQDVIAAIKSYLFQL